MTEVVLALRGSFRYWWPGDVGVCGLAGNGGGDGDWYGVLVAAMPIASEIGLAGGG